MQLTELQIQHYDTFGFLVIPGFLDDAKVQALRHALDIMKAEESGEPDTLKHQGRVVGMFHKNSLLLELFDDMELHGVATQLLRSQKLRFLGDEYASFSTPADWHPDIPIAMPAESLKYGLYLDDVSRGGFLRVVPGSHNAALYESISAYRAAGDKPEIECAHACITQPGDLLLFNLKLWHQGTANPSGTHRRVIFWSVGQDHPEWNFMARNLHNQIGRGEPDAPWPGLILENAPRHRLELLDVYEAGAAKQQALAEIYRVI